MQLTEEQIEEYRRDGYVLLRGAITQSVLDDLERQFLGLVEDWGGRRFESAQSEALTQFLLKNRELERKLYDGIRSLPWLVEFSKCADVCMPVTELLGEPVRLDQQDSLQDRSPGGTRELAVWHQDYPIRARQYGNRHHVDTATGHTLCSRLPARHARLAKFREFSTMIWKPWASAIFLPVFSSERCATWKCGEETCCSSTLFCFILQDSTCRRQHAFRSRPATRPFPHPLIRQWAKSFPFERQSI